MSLFATKCKTSEQKISDLFLFRSGSHTRVRLAPRNSGQQLGIMVEEQ